MAMNKNFNAAGIRDQSWNDGWRALLRKVPKNHRWGQQHTEVLKSIALPCWSEAPKDTASENDRLGDAWLPPRLYVDDEIRTLEYGVLFIVFCSSTRQ
jgi:hypothetical protein